MADIYITIEGGIGPRGLPGSGLAGGTTGQVLAKASDADFDEEWITASGTGDALVANPLSQFAATTSAQLAGVMSDETGTGSLVFATSPTLITPLLGTPTSGNLANCTFPTLNQSTTGNAATATALETGRTINGTTFDGTANITVTAAGSTLTGTSLSATIVTSSLTSLGTITVGTWQGTAIADSYIASAATWNAKASATVVTDYIGAAATITSSLGVATPNAANGRSQKFPLTENVTTFNVPTNLADGQSMLITILQYTTPRTLSLAAGYTLIGSGVAADIAALTFGQYAWLTISRYGTDYLIAINTEA